MEKLEVITSNHQEFLKFLKIKFPFYHKSNVFLRDIEYGIMEYLKEKNMGASYRDVFQLSPKVTDYLEKQNIFNRIDSKTWVLNYEEFLTPKVEKPAPITAAKV